MLKLTDTEEEVFGLFTGNLAHDFGKPLTHVHIFILHLLSSVKIVAHNENVMTNNCVGLCLLAKMFCNYSWYEDMSGVHWCPAQPSRAAFQPQLCSCCSELGWISLQRLIVVSFHRWRRMLTIKCIGATHRPALSQEHRYRTLHSILNSLSQLLHKI